MSVPAIIGSIMAPGASACSCINPDHICRSGDECRAQHVKAQAILAVGWICPVCKIANAPTRAVCDCQEPA